MQFHVNRNSMFILQHSKITFYMLCFETSGVNMMGKFFLGGGRRHCLWSKIWKSDSHNIATIKHLTQLKITCIRQKQNDYVINRPNDHNGTNSLSFMAQRHLRHIWRDMMHYRPPSDIFWGDVSPVGFTPLFYAYYKTLPWSWKQKPWQWPPAFALIALVLALKFAAWLRLPYGESH